MIDKGDKYRKGTKWIWAPDECCGPATTLSAQRGRTVRVLERDMRYPDVVIVKSGDGSVFSVFTDELKKRDVL